jgi:hypothetical protein
MNEAESEAFLIEHPDLRLDDGVLDALSDALERDRAQGRLVAARLAMRAKREAGEVVRHFNPDERLEQNPRSLRRAVNAMCWQCMGRASSWRADVRGCTATGCALYGFRPGVKTVKAPDLGASDGGSVVG